MVLRTFAMLEAICLNGCPPFIPMRLAIVSDIHYAGAGERERVDYPYVGIQGPVRRFLTWQYRHWIWQRDPFVHNHLLDRFIEATANVDLAVANGDYSCDSAGIGVADGPSCDSARECLGKLRAAFGARFRAVIGDHELGKMMMSSGRGGLRLESFERSREELHLDPFWRVDVGRYVLMGVTSTLLALPIYETEALPHERSRWRELRERHVVEIHAAFGSLAPEERVLLFCHDPSALPFLWREEVVRAKLAQVERTIIGHLHTPLVLRLGLGLSGMPEIRFMGHTPRRLSRALREARLWKPFKPLLCPSTPGSQLLKDGGFYLVELDEEARRPAQFEFRALPW